MSIYSGTADNYTYLLNTLNGILTEGHALPITWGGAGNGALTILRGSPSSVQETITVTWTSATAFNVTGSVTGSMGSGTVGAQFVHARVSFMAVAGGTPWANGSTAQFVMTPAWTALRSVAGSEYIWKAPGDGGTDQIYGGVQVFSNATGDYFNWRMGAFTGFNSGLAFASQPGACTRPVIPMWNSSIPYWVFVTGKQVQIVAKISTVYVWGGFGFLDAYASPGQWSYPIWVGGSMSFNSEPAATSTSWRWSYTGNEFRLGILGGYYSSADNDCSLRVRTPAGSWRGISGISNSHPGMAWPWVGTMSDMRPNLDGSYPTWPVVLAEDYGGEKNVFGEIPGAAATIGYGNAAENTLTIGRDSWIVFQNAFRTTKTDYFCMRAA
jgi:hypothetical protein